jgi:hypothetical protein
MRRTVVAVVFLILLLLLWLTLLLLLWLTLLTDDVWARLTPTMYNG